MSVIKLWIALMLPGIFVWAIPGIVCADEQEPYTLAPAENLVKARTRLEELEHKMPTFKTWFWLPGELEGLAVYAKGSNFKFGTRNQSELDGTRSRWGICGWHTTSNVCVIPWLHLTNEGVRVLLGMDEGMALEPLDVYMPEKLEKAFW